MACPGVPRESSIVRMIRHCGIYQENIGKRGKSGRSVDERAAIHGFLNGCLGNGNIPDSQNRKTASSRNKRQEKEGGQKF